MGPQIEPHGSAQISGDGEDRLVAFEPHVVFRKTSSDLTMLFDRMKGVMYELNESASAVVEQIGDKPKTVSEIVAGLMLEFDAPQEEVVEHVNGFVDDFLEAGLLKIGN
jgi:hypothetical protein